MTLTKSDRLLTRAEFSAVLDPRRNVSDRRLVLAWLPTSLGHARLGLVVGKTFGNAVARNRFKRRVREIFRRRRPEASIDFVVMPARHGEAKVADYAALEESFCSLLKRVLQRV